MNKSKTITIDPVTRIEGHAKVFINLADNGEVASAGLVVNELRGFEKILVGMEADRLPLITARICGVCPTAHHLAATNALDHAAGVEPPPAAKLLRELMFMGHLVHSHSLSLFVLQGPDLVLGLDADPAIRNVVGIVQANPELAKKALRIRSIGQFINEMIGGRGTHPVTSVVGGITFTLDNEKTAQLRTWLDEALALLKELAPAVKQLLFKMVASHPEMLTEWSTPSWSLGTVRNGTISMIEGELKAIDETGKVMAEFPTHEYHSNLVESVIDWSYMKQVHFAQKGNLHEYRVGSLARFNVAGSYGTEWADSECAEFRKQFGTPAHLTVLQPYAKLIELIWAVEYAIQAINNPEIRGETRVPAKYLGGRGVGHVEAPRGTLFHDYEIDDNGIVRAANLIVATQQNYTSINRTIMQAATSHVVGKKDDAALLNAIEFGIRCYDPCLSCATHALGTMPLEIHVTHGNEVLQTIRRQD
ncbi:Ni/Fe hydrogenase subunit alpha [Geobacter pelophilus]|uniref:Ni/Fe hydrogenase subunit alpha n=1 Tax=Geoanaerobacter pelophilus TaxID=60036 RepID=A0AAW4L084_9BACT|nr:Ni/Fe hydrogenase subunit alpha [Geoanaerobacter pelophilus]MBT0664079.1 Ni/Fe hydrogenase subunit alpha [Geoanaerobacter pelophilus]